MSNPEINELANSIATAARSATSIDCRWRSPVINLRRLLTLGVGRNRTGWALA